ncbi:MAG: VOC family protein [Pseudolabrys sp.]
MKDMTIRPFLMFEGKAEEAMTFYTSLLPDGRIDEITRYDAAGPGAAGSVKVATFTIAGQSVMCIDSPVKHAFTFTPSFSFFVECRSEDEIRNLGEKLRENGQVMMPLDNYGFSKLFTWVSDRYGVSWQLTLN